MPARHELATSRLSWLAIIPTCLAKIGILVPARGDCGLGGNFASKARHGGSRRGTGSLLLTVGCSSSSSSSGSASGNTGSGTNWATAVWGLWLVVVNRGGGADPGRVSVSLPAQPVLVAARRVS